jgi:alanine-glyoxylate transaminase/(R)-3-amino-2-methylpropionate-pyruvate transaminase
MTQTAPTLPPCAHQPKPYTGPSFAEAMALRKQFTNPGIFLYYKNPIMVVEGHMQYLWDEQGRRYLDAFGGIVTVSVGHCHPDVTQRRRGAAVRPSRTAPPSTSTPPTWPT